MFELNGKTYQTDADTLDVLRSIIPTAKTSGDSTAVMTILFLGLASGRIVEV